MRTLRRLPRMFAAAAAVILIGLAHAQAQEPCKAATKGDSPIAKACAEGGIKKAKEVMKSLVRDARKAGGSSSATNATRTPSAMRSCRTMPATS